MFKSIKDSQEHKPRPLEPGFVRVEYERTEASTAKAYLIDFGDIKKWIPKSVVKLRQPLFNLIDIADWYYDKELE